ncbi:MAG: hypothetical protein CV089_07740 [Nitrospira sp. WS110]|nr:hypothetical protein [Nitrospira sp. WS110]
MSYRIAAKYPSLCRGIRVDRLLTKAPPCQQEHHFKETGVVVLSATPSDIQDAQGASLFLERGQKLFYVELDCKHPLSVAIKKGDIG